jgi:NAD(P)H-nitrite reductase large subunit
MRVVIVGGGIAGTTAAEELRKLAPAAEITIVSEERHPVYSRVLLPHYLKGKVPRERVFLKKAEWYAEQNIEWLAGIRVESCDPKNAFVTLSDGRELPYEKLLITTGGEVRLLLEDRRGVAYFRTLDDADHIAELLREKPGAPAAIYGGGFIACEFLNLFAQYGHPTAIALRGEHFWTGQLLPETGAFINRHIESKGVRILKNAKLVEMAGEISIEALRTDQGETPAGILGVGIGIAPDLGWILDAGIECGDGIRTNEFLQTNVPNVYAAGDIAEFFDTLVDRHMLVGNWMNAQMQGRAVAKTIAGTKTPFKLVSSYATNALGLELIFVGDTQRSVADEIVVKGSTAEGGMTQIHLRKGKVVGGVMVGRNKDRAPVTKAIQEGRGIETLGI